MTTRQVAAPVGAALGLAARSAPWALGGYAAGTLLTAALPVVAAALTKTVIDGLTRPGDLTGAWVTAVVALALAGLLAGVGPGVLTFLRNEVERAVTLVAKSRLFQAVDRITGLSRFENPEFLDQLNLADESGGRGPSRVVDGTFGVAAGLATVVGFAGSLATVSPLMAAIVLLSGLPVLVAELMLSRRRAAMQREITPAERRELFYRDMLATEQAAKEVRLFGLGGFLRRRMLLERGSAQRAEHLMDRRELAVQAALGLFAGIVAGGGLLWVALAARAGRHTVGDVALFVAAVVGVQSALAAVAQSLAKAHNALLLFDSYVSILAAEPDLAAPADPRPIPPLRSGIVFKDVWFRYTDDHPWVLRGADFTLRYGETVGLVGLNGAGKSTIVKLLCRLYDPTRGEILWDGVPLLDVDPAQLRARISAVFQDYVNYEMTAAENIGVGDLTALDDRERIAAAAERAGVHDLLAGLPDGYDTMLSRRFNAPNPGQDGFGVLPGVNPSGGQRQRIAIARAFLRESRDLVILDEPSAGLDAEAEHEVHARLKAQRAGLTSLLISHRLGAVRDADLIVVLADGRVAEQGDHETLMRAGGAYANLFDLQASGYQPVSR